MQRVIAGRGFYFRYIHYAEDKQRAYSGSSIYDWREGCSTHSRRQPYHRVSALCRGTFFPFLQTGKSVYISILPSFFSFLVTGGFVVSGIRMIVQVDFRCTTTSYVNVETFPFSFGASRCLYYMHPYPAWHTINGFI